MISNLNRIFQLVILACCVNLNIDAQQFYEGGSWGDNGNGTFNNPVLPADYRDPDVIRVGKDYYMITSTFWMSPGLTILHSRDLVNWAYYSAAVPDITKINKLYTWSNITYQGGIWAPCISYNKKNKLYYIHWGDNALGFFVVTAKDLKGPWSDPKEVTFRGNPIGPRHDNCGILWEDDGSGYMAFNYDTQGNVYVRACLR
jgi:beta-xylosidase